jgi:EmrB/QacA subfamily drug resistance transporter
MNDQKTALIVSTLAAFMTPFMVSSLNVALPTLGKEFTLDAIALGWIATAYLLSAAVFLIPFGRLGDIYGRKRVFLYGIAFFALFSFLIGLSQSGTMLIALRALQGIGAAMIFGTGVALLISASASSARGKLLGINVSAVYLGLSLGPFLGGLLTQNFGWRSIFYVNGVLGLVILGITKWKLQGEWAEARGHRFDVVGSMLFSLSLCLIMYGSSQLPSPLGIWLFVTGVVALAFFVVWEKRTMNPVLDMRLFSRNTVFRFSNLAALINYSATNAVTFLLSFYLQYVKGLSPQMAGIVLVSQPICMTIVSPLAGRLSDRIEPRIIASAGMAVTVLGLALFTLVDGDSPLLFVTVNLILLGLGFGLFSSPNTNAVMSSVQKESYGVASATLATMRLTGQMLSMGIVMLILSVTIGRVRITPEYYEGFLYSMRLAFVIFSALCLAGIFSSLARGKLRETAVGSSPPGR